MDKEDVADAIEKLVGVVMKPNHHPDQNRNQKNNMNTNTDSGSSK